MHQTIPLHRLVIKPRAITPFPLDAADHAKLRLAPASHVVAAFLQLDRRAAVVTPLPAFPLRDLDELPRRLIFWAYTAGMPAVVTLHAHFCSTPSTFPVFPARVRAAAVVGVDVCGFDPFAAAPGGAVETVLGGVLLVFLVPFHLEFGVEELVDVFEGDVVCGAAFGGHVLGVGEGECENTAEAGVAHAVAAGEAGGAGGRVGGEAGETFDSERRYEWKDWSGAGSGGGLTVSLEVGGLWLCLVLNLGSRMIFGFL